LDKVKRDNQRAYLITYPIASFARPIPIEREGTFIGRRPGDDIQIQIADRHISRRHARLYWEDGHFWVEDLGSQNGTFVNNVRIEKGRLQSHDKITIGHHTYLFLAQPDPVGDLPAKASLETSDTIAICSEEMNLSDIWAQNANHAARGFLHQVNDAATDTPQGDQLAPTRLAMLYQLSERLRNTSQAQAVFEKGIELILEALPAAESTLVAQRSAFDDSYRVAACQFRDPDQVSDDSIPFSQTVFDWVFKEQVTLVSQNLGADQRFQDSDSISMQGLRSIVCVPITGKKHVIGLLYAHSNSPLNPFTKDDALFVSAVANEMALNIDNIRLQQKLLNSERMAAIGLTVSNLAHNMKNLLAVNQGVAQLMDIHIGRQDFPQIQKKWQRVQNSLAGIGKLATEMLEYAKEDALYVKPVDINKMIWTNRHLFEDSLSRDGLTLAYALTRKNPVWPMDLVQLQRALFNLILNAADAVQEKKDAQIKISTAVGNDNQLRISVADNGCGIPQNTRGKVLELFFTTKGVQGTGLGLPMVQKFVEKSGGKLTFQSKEGSGSIFEMTFPNITHEDGRPLKPSGVDRVSP
jgi:K+-sensing histidine kinase KdpD